MSNHEKRDFDSMAANWDENPGRLVMAKAIAAAIQETVPLNRDMDAFDYGCGTGLVTLAMLPHVGSVLAADSSQGMLDVLNSKLQQNNIDGVRTVLLDLETDVPLDEQFDLIFSSMTVHHIADPASLLRKLSAMLRSGGHLCISDLDKEDGSFHSDTTGVLHHGFEREEMAKMFSEAGLTDVSATTAFTIERDTEDGTREFPVFLVAGRKA